MKIEKISDTQIKLILTQRDLTERNIQLEDLTSPSEKTQNLFKEIMEQALMECDFIAENTPLMLEAMPVGLDGIMIIVTKMDNNNSIGNHMKLVSQSKDLRRYKKKSVTAFAPMDDNDGTILIYSFAHLDDVIDVSLRIHEAYQGYSSLYKIESVYYLVLQNDEAIDESKAEALEMILGEYGKKHVSTPLAKYYLIEHGEVILENKAVRMLAKSFA